jgi:hypothetical protein
MYDIIYLYLHLKEIQSVIQILTALNESVRFTELLSSVDLSAKLCFSYSLFSEMWTSYQPNVRCDANCICFYAFFNEATSSL